ncbi:NADPH-dependent FMN reductase [Salinicoccus halodurans]|uniref:FMN-dependent NADPH-azoreductase n=1 Tax=Salinicoccus halodurans TaxID=407035 RepID=A0A0F7HI12_9STAP|nr:NADPH-dependent FMN reductase [Salinicoccus halodurans]AKG72909.1 FMN reductase [Salinicoccus halodurans]SFK75975.1 FMN reductase [Salinicoccus halodurans]
MYDIVVISGSPSLESRSQNVLKYIGSILKARVFSIGHISVRDVPAEDLMFGNFNSPEVNDIARIIENAKGVIVGSPVYKASYSGVLKSLFDILPQDVLKNTPVLPVMSGGSISHLLALEYALKPLISTLKGTTLKGVYYLDSQVDKTSVAPIQDADLIQTTEIQIDDLLEKMNLEKSFS